MTQAIAPDAGKKKLSLAALLSFICGILLCVPFVTGLLAIVLGAIGIGRTRDGVRRGRWMAVAGMILGVFAILAWSGASMVGGGVWAIWKGTAGPRVATHEFIHALADHDMAAAKLHSSGISDADLEKLSDAAQQAGTFKDTWFNNTNINNNSANVSGTASFTHAEKGASQGAHDLQVDVDLEYVGGIWKVRSIRLRP